MLLQMARFPSFYGWIICHFVCVCVCVCVYIYIYIYIYIYTLHLLYPFIYWWMLRLLPYVGYCKQGYNEYIGMHISFWIHAVCFRSIPRHKIAGSYGNSIFNLWGTSILFSIVAAPVYILSNSARGFPFLHILANTCYLLSFWWQLFWSVWGGTSL